MCVSTDGAKMTKSTGVCSTVLWVLNTMDLCQSARHRTTVCFARTAMEQSGLTRWNVPELTVLYTLWARLYASDYTDRGLSVCSPVTYNTNCRT